VVDPAPDTTPKLTAKKIAARLLPGQTYTPLQMSACLFVGLMAEDVDAQRGIVAPLGTPETRARVIDVVKAAFFSGDHDGATHG
jgi:hypothetical protein